MSTLKRLVEIVLEDADTRVRRQEDRARNEARQILLEAQEHVDELRRAAKDLGRTRGSSAEEALQREADREIASVHAGSFEALEERFERRVALALKELPKDEARYATALRTWAASAAARMQGPCEVGTARGDRSAVYELLLSAGAEDFQVVHDPRVHSGFVVRDLDGRSLFDARPEGLAAAMEVDLGMILRDHVAPYEPPER